MATIAELELQLHWLREAGKIKDEALRNLGKTEDLQSERWDLLRRVIEDAGKQYSAMRLDVVEESQRDQGTSLWLSCILTVFVILTPVTGLTGSLLNALNKSAQKKLAIANRQLLSAERVLKRPGTREIRAARTENVKLARDIRKTDEMVAEFAKSARKLEPEITNKLQDKLQDAADWIAETLNKHLFRQDPASKMVQTPNAPIVVVTQTMHEWVDSLVRAERDARYIIEYKVQDLFDIATSLTPQLEAKGSELIAKKRGFKYEEPLPKTNKDALHKLAELRTELAPIPDEEPVEAKKASLAHQKKELRELQLSIESMIWASTYDFTPKSKFIELGSATMKEFEGGNITQEVVATGPFGAHKVKTIGYRMLLPAPLPKGLWKRLIERYIDPDEKKSYKDAKSMPRLGTLKEPGSAPQKVFSPEVRLSYYFGKILYPKLNEENSEMVERFKR
jgi:hypothetical protein